MVWVVYAYSVQNIRKGVRDHIPEPFTMGIDKEIGGILVSTDMTNFPYLDLLEIPSFNLFS